MADDTTLLQRASEGSKKRPLTALAASGTGLSAAVVLFCYTTFPTKSSSSAQWRTIQAQQQEINEIGKGLAQCQSLLQYMTTGEIRLRGTKPNPTNQTERTSP